MKHKRHILPQHPIAVAHCWLLSGIVATAALSGCTAPRKVLQTQAPPAPKSAAGPPVAHTPEGPVAHPPALTGEDSAVVETVLVDLADYRGKDFSFYGPGKLVALIDKTERAYSDDILDDEVRESAGAADITRDLRKDFVRRNPKPVALRAFKPGDKRIVFRDEKSGRTGGWSGHIDTTVRIWVQIGLPAYSPSGDRAMLHFSFGPTPHGANGTYFLVKESGAWRVKWRHFTFYA